MSRLISFAWTTPALLAGAKTCTRRAWQEKYAASFHIGQECIAYDRNPRNGGKPVARIRITHEVMPEPMRDAPAEDYRREGFAWFDAHPDERARALPKLAKELGVPRSDTHDDSMLALWQRWCMSNDTFYVVRFDLLEGPMARLSTEAVLLIRGRLAAGETQVSIARSLDLDPSTISYAARGKTWAAR